VHDDTTIDSHKVDVIIASEFDGTRQQNMSPENRFPHFENSSFGHENRRRPKADMKVPFGWS
jgi:hypothetical protein